MAGLVLWIGAMRLMEPTHVPAGPMLLAAAGGPVTEAVALAMMCSRQKGNLNMNGASWHVVQTFVGSLSIIVAAAVIYVTGFDRIDPNLGMAFGLVLVWASWGIIRESLRILLDTVPRDLDLKAVACEVAGLPGVRDVHHAHAWALTTGKNIVSMHVLVQEGTDAQPLLRDVTRLLSERFGVFFSTVQLETECPESEEAEAVEATSPVRSGDCGPGTTAASARPEPAAARHRP